MDMEPFSRINPCGYAHIHLDIPDRQPPISAVVVLSVVLEVAEWELCGAETRELLRRRAREPSLEGTQKFANEFTIRDDSY